MTSANVMNFVVVEVASDLVVGRYRQNLLCKESVIEKLKQHTPHYLFHLLVTQPDENEAPQTIYNGNLEDYLERTTNEH